MDTVLEGGGVTYGRRKDTFIIRERYSDEGSGTIHLNPSWDVIRCSPETSLFQVLLFLEYNVRRLLVKRGISLIHASAVTYEGSGYVFPAWRHTGKTNTLLSFVLDGGSFLADDRVWIGRDGDAWGYPVPVNVVASNVQSFSELTFDTTAALLRAKISERLSKLVSGRDSLLALGVYFLNKFSLDPSGEYRRIGSLCPRTEHVSKTSIDRFIFLKSVQGTESNTLELSPLSDEEAVNALRATSRFEWNERLNTYAQIHEMLVPQANTVSEMRTVFEREEMIFANAVEAVPCYQLSVPREVDWTNEQLARRVRTEVTSL